MNGIGGFHKPNSTNVEWFTPKWITDELGPFNLDPCSSTKRPWDTAKEHYTEQGLEKEWFGNVWLNPPYNKSTKAWLKKLAEHGTGVALVFARTETQIYFPWVWEYATGILFLKNRLHFHYWNGVIAKGNCGGPHCLIAYGFACNSRLKRSTINGKYINLKP